MRRELFASDGIALSGPPRQVDDENKLVAVQDRPLAFLVVAIAALVLGCWNVWCFATSEDAELVLGAVRRRTLRPEG